MIIAISGSVGSGKTTIADCLGKKLNISVVHLNDLAHEHKIQEVPEIETFDFNLNSLLDDACKLIQNKREENKALILEGHFAHFIDFKLVDFLFVVNRDLKELREVYEQRKYNEKKIEENLEVESLNACFYEGIEGGYTQANGENSEDNPKLRGKIFSVLNDSNIEDVVGEIMGKIKK